MTDQPGDRCEGQGGGRSDCERGNSAEIPTEGEAEPIAGPELARKASELPVHKLIHQALKGLDTSHILGQAFKGLDTSHIVGQAFKGLDTSHIVGQAFKGLDTSHIVGQAFKGLDTSHIVGQAFKGLDTSHIVGQAFKGLDTSHIVGQAFKGLDTSHIVGQAFKGLDTSHIVGQAFKGLDTSHIVGQAFKGLDTSHIVGQAFKGLDTSHIVGQAFRDLGTSPVFSMALTSSATSSILRQVDLGSYRSDLAGLYAKSFNGVSEAALARTFGRQTLRLQALAKRSVETLHRALYPSNLRELPNLTFEAVNEVVLKDGIALYGVPSPSIASRLLVADSTTARKKILEEDWEEIVTDCHAYTEGIESGFLNEEKHFLLESINALMEGHFAAAQALVANLLDTIIRRHFQADRAVLLPSRRVVLPDGYENFMSRKYIAVAPIWAAFKQFYIDRGDAVPSDFSRHATAHAVSREQIKLQNSVQGIMLVCGLLGFLRDSRMEDRVN